MRLIATKSYRKSEHCRSGTVYVAVMGVALIMGVISMTAMQVARIQHRTVTMVDDMAQARLAAQSAVEIGLSQIDALGSNWRSSLTSDTITTPISLGNSSNATMSWAISDSDGDLTDTDTELTLKGIGAVGNAIKVNQVLLRIAKSYSTDSEQELRSYTDQVSTSEDDLKSDKYWGQYLKVSLPNSAIGWKVTSVDLYIAQKNSNKNFEVCVYRADGSYLPDTLIDSVELNSSDYSSSLSWHKINFSGDYELDIDDGICITLETSESDAPIRIRYESGGVSEADSALISGDPSWNQIETDKDLLFRVYGVYWTDDGTVEVIPGSWKWVANP